jgi:hypothetical protein
MSHVFFAELYCEGCEAMVKGMYNFFRVKTTTTSMPKACFIGNTDLVRFPVRPNNYKICNAVLADRTISGPSANESRFTLLMDEQRMIVRVPQGCIKRAK